MRSRDIRQSFVDAFVAHDHLHLPSAPLIPRGDATLLFTNAGMVQFKNYFLGVETAPHPRAVTSQKCLRVSGKHNDLDNVGPSPRHHTFFEMLGNFSFGDYFKAEAIEMAWKLVTGAWGVPAEHLFVSVFEDDDTAAGLWRDISSLPEQRILRCGADDNFWAMGDTGPCGPCSEIFVDCAPDRPEVSWAEGTESGRYLEIWNLVFMQYQRSADGTLAPLPKPSIDTGSGLERVSAVLQGVASNYDTDLFQPVIAAAASAAACEYGDGGPSDVALRVIADHLRAVAFLLADGVIPGNEGRGYVLRRILRRAVRHGMRLGLDRPFLGSLLPVLGETLDDAYPELASTRDASATTITAEEEKFLGTVAAGARFVQEAIEEARAARQTSLAGEVAFRLYDTFGLPIEMLREIAEEEGLAIDEDGFRTALALQRQRSRVATSELQQQLQGLRGALIEGHQEPTPFLGYDRLVFEGARVVRMARLGEGGDGDSPAGSGTDSNAERAEKLDAGERGVAVLDRTIFYAESGGQVADVGELEWSGGTARVVDVQRDVSGAVFHWLELTAGSLAPGAVLTARVDASRRADTERHHTATHLLHAALRQHLGPGARQAGSLVHPERLRFDYTHSRPLDASERQRLEDSVSSWVRGSTPVVIEERAYEDAIADGAMALFGEKYADRVRTVSVPNTSLELCGGCHVRNTGEIGSFVITSERAVASGVRRIEALAGPAADAMRRRQAEILAEIETEIAVPPERIANEVRALRDRLRDAERELSRTRLKLLAQGNGDDSSTFEIEGVAVMVREVPPAPHSELRTLADVLRKRLGSGVVVLGSRDQGKVALVAAVTSDLEGRVHAGRLARAMGDAIGGSGGGRADFAQAGGKDSGDLTEAFAAARATLGQWLEGR